MATTRPVVRNAEIGILEAIQKAQQVIGVEGQTADAGSAVAMGKVLQGIYTYVNDILKQWADAINQPGQSQEQITQESTSYQLAQTIGQNEESQWSGYQSAATSATTQDGTNMQSLSQFAGTVNTLEQAITADMGGWN